MPIANFATSLCHFSASPSRTLTRRCGLALFFTLSLISCKSSHPPLTEDQIAAQQILKERGATVVFDSMASGTFGIYILDRNSMTPVVLRDTPLHEITPDPSPDGSKVVYAVGKSAERGQRFDIWIVDGDGKNASLLIENGNYPSFYDSGRKVLFERGQRHVLSYDIATESESMIFDGTTSEFRGNQVFLPKLSPDQKFLTITTNYKRRYSNYQIDLATNELTLIGYGCQQMWAEDSSLIYWVSDQNFKQKTAIMKYDRTAKTNEVWVDNDKPRGIDYFPNLSSDKSLLLFSAAEKRQHYILGDYQPFLRDLITGKQYRLINDGHNTRWPKFIVKADSTWKFW
jgi:Tol biopolymer transport system component